MTKPCLDFESLYWLDKDKKDAALDYLYDNVDEALHAGHDAQSWPGIEALIEQIDLERCSISLLVGVLCITLYVKDKLKGRKELVQILRERWLESEGERRTERLLSGLE